MSCKTHIIVTMAGFGERFRKAGYSEPKYRINVRGKSLFSWSMESLSSFIKEGTAFIFIVRKDDAAETFIAEECAVLGIKSPKVISLTAPTDGQATTATYASRILSDVDTPIGIYNIDTYVKPSHITSTAIQGDGWIPCFPGRGDAWSFARVDKDNQVLELQEKHRISPHATVGFYWFRSFALYEQLYKKFYSTKSNLQAGECYIAPMYNQLIADGGKVYIHEIPINAVYPLGTPSDVKKFAED